MVLSRYIICGCFIGCSVFCSPLLPPTNLLNEKQIQNYVGNVLDALFALNHDASDDKRAIEHHVTKKLVEPTTLEKEYNIPVERTQQQVYQEVLNAIVNYVEKKSFYIAKQHTGNHRVTSVISKSIKLELSQKISSSGDFQIGALGEFVGNRLEQKVRNMSYRFDVPYQKVIKRFDERRCRVCLNRFSKDLSWIYVSPCGHDMCVVCAQNYFIKKDKKVCPACNQEVDKYQLNWAF